MKLASIETILNLTPIDGADKIELATVLGWQVIVKKEEYNIGDLSIFIPIDTTIDPNRECFKFLKNSKNPTKRIIIKTIKIKGVYSQGLLLPISAINIEPSIGLDVSNLLDVQKYEKECCLETTTYFVPFPTQIIPKTNEDNLKTNHNVIQEFKNLECYITLKMDGSSLTIIKNDTLFTVCSRNFMLDGGHIMYQFIANEGLKDKIIGLKGNYAIQGEFCGPKVNGNKMKLKAYKWYIFTIKNLDTNKYLDYYELNTFCQEYNFEMVPLIGLYNIDETWTIEKFQEISNEVKYTTPMNEKVYGEGIVVRPIKTKWSDVLNKYLSVKIINQNY
jgi:RNA ligase (TIGR02306 family)